MTSVTELLSLGSPRFTDAALQQIESSECAEAAWMAALSRAMCAAGAGDGITGARDGSVDGLPLSVHLGVLGALRGVLEGEFGAGDAGAGGGKGRRQH
jgi:hypothetical protein